MAGKLEQTKAPVDPARASVQSKSTLCTLNSIGGKSNGTTNQGCHRVLVSLFSWPGQLLSLNPCQRPKILARMLFWGILSLTVVILEITAYLIRDCDYWGKQTNA